MNCNIIGLGTVGTALLAAHKYNNDIKIFDEKLELFDKDSDIHNDDMSITFVCVNTPPKELGEIDTTILRQVLDDLVYKNHQGIVVIKSTVLYSEIKEYIDKLNIVINPEFLNDATSIEDFKNESYIVLGGNIFYTKQVAYYLSNYFDYNFRNESIEFEFVSHEEAIDFKYARNIKLAMNVLYWEMMDEIMSSKKIAKMMKKLPTPENNIVGKDGYRGFGQSHNKKLKTFSACLDKDLNAKLNETNHPLLKAMDKYNKDLYE